MEQGRKRVLDRWHARPTAARTAERTHWSRAGAPYATKVSMGAQRTSSQESRAHLHEQLLGQHSNRRRFGLASFLFVCGRGKKEEKKEGKREEEEGESRGEQKKSCRALISLLKDSPPRGNPALAWRTASAKVCVLPGCNDVPMINQYSRDSCFLLSWRRQYDDLCHDGYRSCYCPQPSER